MNDPILRCQEERRREDVRAASLFGLDYVEVVDDQQLRLNVFFLGKAPQKIEKANVVLAGGRRIRDVQITSVRVLRQPDPTLDDYLEVRVDKPGDFSTYTISIVKADRGQPTGKPMDGFDPRYDQVSFSFKASCPTPLDCQPPCSCPPPTRTQPDLDYLAKDYESFRQVILDRLALIMPDWTETHAPDIGITLVELLAYAGDYLSYYQDAVATEAYLGTARERISVRRHARLVDYIMHDGCQARAWLTIHTDRDQQLDPTQVFFTTPYPGAPKDRVLTSADLVGVPTSSYEVFEPLYWNGGQGMAIYAVHSAINFYAWGDCECCLAPGATSATLIDGWVVPDASTVTTAAATASTPTDGPPGAVRALRNLKAGDILIVEEVLGPKTGQAPDADPSHRQAVRLTRVTRGIDPLYGQQPYGTPIVEIEWASEDALRFPLCISSKQPPPACGCMENVSVARGNVILIGTGSDTGETLGTVPATSATPQCPKCCQPATITVTPGLFRPALNQQPLTFSVPLPPPCSAADLIVQDPRQALPWISLTSIPPAPAWADRPLFTFDDLAEPTGLAKSLKHPADASAQFLLALLIPATRQLLTAWDGSLPLPATLRAALINDLDSLLQTWSPRRDLLESGPDDRDFVVEMDNDGFAHLRFGDGVCGCRPEAGTLFSASYRVGNGKSGNVGAETITYIVFRKEKLSGVNLEPRNPLAAAGGTEPEPIEDVKLLAPYAFRSQLERAITAEDYAALAQDNERRLEARASLEADNPEICSAPFTRLQRARAALRWTGSWYTALVAIDPVGTESAAPELVDEITLYLEPFRRVGHDLLVSQAQYVPLKLSITICVLPTYLRGHVQAAALDALSNRVLPNGTLGFFHPDNLTFGDGIYVSRLLAAVQAIAGVQNAMVTELERFEISEPLDKDMPGEELPMSSALMLGPFEIAQLDNDPSFPENGVLVLSVQGGR